MRSRMEEIIRYTPADELYKIGLDYLYGTTAVNDKSIKDKLVAIEFFQASADKGNADAVRLLDELKRE